MKTLREKSEAVLKDKRFTSYQIAKETGMAIPPIDRRRAREDLNLNSMTLETAEKLAKFYDLHIGQDELIDPPAKAMERLPKGTPVFPQGKSS